MMVKDQKNHKEPRKNAHQHQATMINQVTTIKPCLPSLHTIFKFITRHVHCLVVVGLSGGLTSVIQMCDLVANKLLKQLMCGGYYQCAFIQDKKANIAASGGNFHNECIKITIHNDEMISIVETAVRAFNRK